MDNDMAGLAFDEEYHRVATGCDYYAPSSSAETAYSVENVQTGADHACQYYGLPPAYQWSEASSSPERSQNTSDSVTNVQSDAEHIYHYHGVRPGYESSELSSSQVSEPLFSSPVRGQDNFTSIGASPKYEDAYQAARNTVAPYDPTSSMLAGSSVVDGVPVSTVDPALSLLLKNHFDRVNQLKELIVAAGRMAKEHESRINADLREMWDKNADIRPRGLKGGRARKNRSIHGNYVSFKQTAAVSETSLTRRLEVEKKDLLARGRLDGLKAMNELCLDAADWLQKQQDHCESLQRYATAFGHGFATEEVVTKLSEVQDTVFGPEIIQKVEDMEEMVRVVHAEYEARD